MKLFISWSGERSRQLAEGFYRWIPGVINAVEPWLSSNDIDPGVRWGPALAGELEKTKYGIICLCAENLDAPWLLFEAGALSKYVDRARVVPLLLDIKPTDIKGPLAQFQAIQATETDLKKLITGINLTVFDSGEKGLDKTYIDEAFKIWWPKLQTSFESIPKSSQDVKRSERSEREMIEELLILVRKLSRNSPRATNQQILDEMFSSPPPDNFPAGWEKEWQPIVDAAYQYKPTWFNNSSDVAPSKPQPQIASSINTPARKTGKKKK